MSSESNSLLRLPAVMQIAALGRSSIFELTRRGEFPQPIRVGRRCTQWVESEVRDWVNKRIAQARTPAAAHIASQAESAA